MTIENIDINAIIPYEHNPRKNDDAVKYVKASIEQFGFKVPVIIDKDNIVVCGHTRLKAAKELNMAEIPCVRADDLTEEQIKAFRLADNKVSEFAEWDYEELTGELEGITELDMEEFGFFEDTEEKAPETQEDGYVESENITPRAKVGDIYQLGRHRLMCGDSTNPTDVEKLIGGVQIELVMTDPPYNMHYDGAGIIRESVKNVKERIKDIVDFNAWDISYLSSMDIGSIYIFTSKDLIPEYFKIFEGWKFNILTWIKTNNPPMTHNVFLPDIEYLLYFHKGKRVWNNGLKPMDIYRKAYFSSRKEGHEEIGDVHPTMKPLKMLSDKIKISSNKNGNVLDLFGGSGSTLVACEQLERNCFMMEYDPHYVDVIIDRWEKLTGQQAELIN